MKKALISPNEVPTYVSGWGDYNSPIYTQVPNSARVAEVCEQEFEIAPPLFWTQCNDNVVADQFYYQTTTQQILPMPESKQKPSAQTVTALTSAIDSQAKTIAVADSGNFSVTGTLKIGEEKISYSNNMNNTFTVVQRGVGGTVATSHASGAVVNYLVPSQ